MRNRTVLPIAALASAATLALAAPASATTFCVPGFNAACPNNGTNVAQANLPTAMTTSASDGIADRIMIGAGTLTTPSTFDDSGTDPLDIVGAGAGATILTSSSTGNVFVANLNGRPTQTLRDLTIRIPASFPDSGGGGAGLQLRGSADNVDIESRNGGGGSDGLVLSGGSVFRGGHIFGAAGGLISNAVEASGAPGTVTLQGTTITSPSWGVVADNPTLPIALEGVRIVSPKAYGVIAASGGNVTVHNSVITLDSGTGSFGAALYANTFNANPSAITADHVTIFGAPGTTASAAGAVVNAAAAGGVTVTVSNSVIRGFANAYTRTAPVNIARGDANLTIRSSNLKADGTSAGDGSVSLGAGNIDADPLFAGSATGDFHLLAGSPSIDAGDPAAGLTTDFDGAARPVDGNGDGSAVRDQGAFEYQPPAAPVVPTPAPVTPPRPVAPAGDRTAPVLSALKLLAPLRAGHAGRIALTVSEKSKITLTFTRTTGHGKAKRTTRVRLTFTAKPGRNVLKVKAGKLKARRYALSASATDAAGNRSRALRRTVTVRR